MNIFLQVAAWFPQAIEKGVRAADAWWCGTETVRRFHRRSLFAFFLPLPVCVFVVYGPAFLSLSGGHAWRGFVAVSLVAAAVLIHVGYFLQDRRHRMAWLHFAFVILLTAATLLVADPSATEASAGIYRHYYGPLAALAMCIAVPFVWLLRRWRIFALPGETLARFQRACDPARIVAQPARSVVRPVDVFNAVAVALLHTPLHVITPVAFFFLFAPSALVTGWVLVVVALLSLALFAASNYDPERDAFVRFVRRNFLTGGSLVVTVVAIAFAGLRVAGVDYVTTVLDAEVKMTVFSYLASSYALLWLYDFWVEQATIGLLGDLDDFEHGTGTLLRHGSGRIMVAASVPESAPRMLEPAAFLHRIAETAEEGERQQLREEAGRLDQLLRGYMLSCGVVFTLALAIAYYTLHGLPQKPGLLVTPAATPATPATPPTFDLADRLTKRSTPVILLAASGGGTRAAIYTAAVLHGLQRVHKLDHLLVGSGVSGGSAALAYYAAHARELDDDAAWSQMREQLAFPFIDEVLAGFGEWRIATAGRLGTLLTESFERHLGPPVQLGDIRELGLIFNTSLCGVGAGTNASKAQAGGRLVITNLDSTFDLALPPPVQDQDMPFHVVRAPQASIFAAASLSANFPPVFSNAAVDVAGDPLARYWVTDGGAVENRGELSILLALAEALSRLAAARSTAALPDITVITAEASGVDTAYHSDRGLGASLGAATQLTKRLVRELRARVSGLHAGLTGGKGVVRFVDLPMPDALRVKGTFGTHWMMPGSITFRDRPAQEDKQPDIELSKATALKLIDALFAVDFSADYLRREFPDLPEPDRVFAAMVELRTAWLQLR